MRRLLATIVSMLALVSCADGKVFKKGAGETKPPANAGAVQKANASEATPEVIPVSRSVYNMRVQTTAGWHLCDGTVILTVWSDYHYNPQGKMTCVLLGDRDIAPLFQQQDIAPMQEAQRKTFPEYGKIYRLPNPPNGGQGGFFTPPRPYLLGPLIQNPAEYDHYTYSETSQLFYTGPEGQLNDTGAFYVQVKEVGIKFQPEGYPSSFDNVIHWSLKTSGFINSPRSKLRMAQEMEYYMSVRPIALPQIIMYTELPDLGTGASGGIIKAITGPVKIQLTLKEYTPL